MPENTTLPSRRAEARARAKQRRARNLDRREGAFEMFLCGYTHQQIAKSTNMSAATIRRMIDAAVAQRRMDSPDRFVRVQVARLMKALSYADQKLERGDVDAFKSYLNVLTALDRYHGLDVRAPAQPLARLDRVLTPAPLALPSGTHVNFADVSSVADFGAQAVEIITEATDSPDPDFAPRRPGLTPA